MLTFLVRIPHNDMFNKSLLQHSHCLSMFFFHSIIPVMDNIHGYFHSILLDFVNTIPPWLSVVHAMPCFCIKVSGFADQDMAHSILPDAFRFKFQFKVNIHIFLTRRKWFPHLNPDIFSG